MHDPRNGDLIAALNHGHFGIKLHRSRDGGATWTEIAAPKYPEKPEGYKPKTPVEGAPVVDWSLKLVWALEPGGADQPGVIWCGTLPGGLFKSEDGGDSWALNRELWDDPRREQWFGGGADQPGIHSICVDPRDSRHVKVGVSCGGVWTTRDGGRQWSLTAKGMRAKFMPPDKQYEENVQDPHMVAQCRSNPDVLWVQHHNGIFKSDRRRGDVDRDHRHHAVVVRIRRRGRIRTIPTPRGSCPARAMRSAARSTAASSSIARAMAARPSRRSRAGCRSSTPTISSFATRSTWIDSGRTLIVRIDDRIGVGQRGRRRFVERAVVEPAAGLRGEVRKSR